MKSLNFFAIFWLLVVASLSAADAPTSKPNIIFILADDLGIGNVSCYGADHFQTPNIDRLAASGMRFNHCYAAPLCGPSRALLMTGRYASHTGMTGNDSGPLNLSAALGTPSFGLFGNAAPHASLSPRIQAILPDGGPPDERDGMARLAVARVRAAVDGALMQVA